MNDFIVFLSSNIKNVLRFISSEKGLNVLNFVLISFLVSERLGIFKIRKRRKQIDTDICKSIFSILTRNNMSKLTYLLGKSIISKEIMSKIDIYSYSMKDKKDFRFYNKKMQNLKDNFDEKISTLRATIKNIPFLSINFIDLDSIKKDVLYVDNKDEYSLLDFNKIEGNLNLDKNLKDVESSYFAFYCKARELYEL